MNKHVPNIEEQELQLAADSAKKAKPKGLLYHYTDQKGMLGILENKSIWATHVRYLNDASEFIHGINVAKESVKETRINLESILRGSPDDASRGDMSLDIGEIVSKHFSCLFSVLQQIHVYVACFFDSGTSERPSDSQSVGDSLGQWRAYSRGSAGFSIGFDKGSLIDEIEKRQAGPEGLLLFGEKCTYDCEEQLEILKKEASEISPAILEFIKRSLDELDEIRHSNALRDAKECAQSANSEKANSPAQTEGVPKLVDILMQKVNPFSKSMTDIAAKMAIKAVFLKHSAFRDEKEWRIARIFGLKPIEMQFRPGKSSLIPYIAIPLPILNEGSPSLIQRIIVGPSPEIENAVAATKMLLTSRGFNVRSSRDNDGIEVLPSKIPYRDW